MLLFLIVESFTLTYRYDYICRGFYSITMDCLLGLCFKDYEKPMKIYNVADGQSS